MKCPECGRLSQVVGTVPGEAYIRRRRECTQGHRFTTFEVINRRSEDRPPSRSAVDKWLKSQRIKP